MSRPVSSYIISVLIVAAVVTLYLFVLSRGAWL
jgi:hypothetical protein